MIEVGKSYKIKDIVFDANTDKEKILSTDILYKVLAEDKGHEAFFCEDEETGEVFYFHKSAFVDPETPDDTKTYMATLSEKLNKVMHPMNLSFWKDLTEDMGGAVSASAVAGGGCGLGAAPCPAMGQITSGGISGCLVNGIPVAGKSVKKKKKKSKKNEEAISSSPSNVQEHCHVGHNIASNNIIQEDKENVNPYNLIPGKEYDLTPYFHITLIDNKKNEDVEPLFIPDGFEDKYAEKTEVQVTPEQMLDEVEETFDPSKILTTIIKNNREIIKVSVQYDTSYPAYLHILKLEFLDIDEETVLDEVIEEDLTIEACIDELTYLFSKNGVIDGELYESIDSIISRLLEDFHEEYEAITEQISKYLDKLNFKYANTEDIIYKKEGEYKYLFKFDNGEGIIKIKVSKGDDILVEKEYKIDETEDIQPIFDEIESIYKQYGL